MAMGKRKPRQESLFITTDSLAQSAGHPFYQRLNALLAEADFDRWIEAPVRGRTTSRTEKRGQPSVPPGVYFRMLLVGYFEGLDSPAGHRLAVCRQPVAAAVPGRAARRGHAGPLDPDQHPQAAAAGGVRGGVPVRAGDRRRRRSCSSGKTVGVDSTTLEANAAMKSIVRRDTGEDWKAYVTRLMREDGRDRPGGGAVGRGRSGGSTRSGRTRR